MARTQVTTPAERTEGRPHQLPLLQCYCHSRQTSGDDANSEFQLVAVEAVFSFSANATRLLDAQCCQAASIVLFSRDIYIVSHPPGWAQYVARSAGHSVASSRNELTINCSSPAATQSNHDPVNLLKYQPRYLKDPLSLMKNTSLVEAVKAWGLLTELNGNKKNMIWD